MSEDTKAPDAGELTTTVEDAVLPDLPPLSIFDLCETDDNLSENGKWFTDVFAPGDGIAIKLRSFASARAVNVRTVLLKKYQRYQKKGEFPPEVDQRMMIEQLVDSIIVDWKGIRGRDNKEIPYSKEAAILLCKMTNFRATIVQLATASDAFKAEAKKEVEGNS
jgi:hypothetical protein